MREPSGLGEKRFSSKRITLRPGERLNYFDLKRSVAEKEDTTSRRPHLSQL